MALCWPLSTLQMIAVKQRASTVVCFVQSSSLKAMRGQNLCLEDFLPRPSRENHQLSPADQQHYRWFMPSVTIEELPQLVI
jgi:hypothetical protein